MPGDFKTYVYSKLLKERTAMNDITIRPIIIEDALQLEFLFETNRSRLLTYFPKTSHHLRQSGAIKFIEQKLEERIKKETYFFTVADSETNKMIGGVIAREIDWSVPKCELAYFIDSGYGGKGITSKAVQWLVNYCFTALGMEKICIKLNPANEGSRKVALKNGFVKEGYMKNEYRTGEGQLTDVEYYGLSKQPLL